jgi:acyl-CoA dehydrogenase
MVACLVRHAAGSDWHRELMRRLAAEQLLLASSTTDGQGGGDLRKSDCAVVADGPSFALTKSATVVSYGAQADAIVTTARRAPDAPATDQVLVAVMKEDYGLDRLSDWDTLGMRGTCSPGYKMASSGAIQQVVPGSFADASAQTMVSYSHILWSAVWLGIASAAVHNASTYVRAEARKKPGTVPQAAHRLAEVMVTLQAMRNNVAGQAAEFDSIMARPDGMEQLLTIGWALKMNNIKVGSSEMAPRIVHDALQIVGIGGYKNDGKYSVGRHYRDSLSAALMISNERIFAKTASMLLVYKDE